MSTIISKLTFVAAALFTCALVSGCTRNGLDETEYLVDPSADDDEADGVKADDGTDGSTGTKDGVKGAESVKDPQGVKSAGDGDTTPDGYHEE